MNEYHPYIRLMTDIIDSGVWADLSSAAKTLYPVLLKFSDKTFKPVWPNTETLMRLTGFKTKKSIVHAKKELTQAGLLFQVPGKGRTSTKYYFSFNYEGSKITPLGDQNVPLSGMGSYASEGNETVNGRGENLPPNHINITISNTNQWDKPEALPKNKEEKTSGFLEQLIGLFGTEIAFQAYAHAQTIQMEGNFEYLKGSCKKIVAERNKEVLDFKQNVGMDPSLPHPASWLGFLDWASNQLSPSTWQDLEKLKINVDGKVLIVQSKVSGFSRQIIQKYFTEKSKPSLLVLFSSEEEGSRLSEIR
ncbi:helix-turn-helix domain-containing protein [Leptospira ilyithenensis]|nr:helix-turn-helix domain-containing protein [Leptospira ilyithenensis]